MLLKHVGIASLTERRSVGLKVTFYTGVIIIHSNGSSQPPHVNYNFMARQKCVVVVVAVVVTVVGLVVVYVES